MKDACLDHPTITSYLQKYLAQKPFAFSIFFIAPVLSAVQTNLTPYCLKLIIENFTKDNLNSDWNQVTGAFILAAIGWIIFVVLSRLQHLWQCYLIPQLMTRAKQNLFGYTLRRQLDFFVENFPGNIAQKISDLPKAIENILFFVRWRIIAVFATIILALVILIGINYQFAIVLAIYACTKFYAALKLCRDVRERAIEHACADGNVTGTTVDSMTNIFNIKVFATHEQEEHFVARDHENELHKHQRLMLGVNKAKAVLDVISTVMLFLIYYLLLHGYKNNVISAGDLVFVFTISFNIMLSMWQLCEGLPDLYKEIGVANQALKTIYTNINEKLDVKNKKFKLSSSKITFTDVSFKYKHSSAFIFSDFNLTIYSGSKVGLVGYSGAGKSSLVNILLGLYPLDSGKIYIDDMDVSLMDAESRRQTFSVVPQNPMLFNRSIIDNIAYGNPLAKIEEVIEVAKLTECHDFIQNLPKGYNTIVGNGGASLSYGQRQRITIARALLSDAPIVILDEPTSALDSITESKINRSLSHLLSDKTAIVIAHRLSTLAKMDRIVVLENGKILEDGSHADLVSQGGQYKLFWETCNVAHEQAAQSIIGL